MRKIKEAIAIVGISFFVILKLASLLYADHHETFSDGEMQQLNVAVASAFPSGGQSGKKSATAISSNSEIVPLNKTDTAKALHSQELSQTKQPTKMKLAQNATQNEVGQSSSSEDSPLALLLRMVVSEDRRGDVLLSNSGFTQDELLVNPWNKCGLIVNQLQPSQYLERQKKWDGTFQPNTKIGYQSRVYFTDVDEKYTKLVGSDEPFMAPPDGYFTLKFFSDGLPQPQYGRQERFELYRDSEEGPLIHKFIGDEGHTAESNFLGLYADGSTFSLLFKVDDKKRVIQLVKSIFAECPFKYTGPKCLAAIDVGLGSDSKQCQFELKSDGEFEITKSRILANEEQQQDPILAALTSQVGACLSVPREANDPKTSVRIHFWLNTDGSVKGKPKVEQQGGGRGFDSLARAAISAILQCQKYKLPIDEYEQWKDNVLIFQP